MSGTGQIERAEPARPIDLDTAIDTARAFFAETIAKREPVNNLHFEEFERADNGDWLITFGYDRETTNPLARLGIEGKATERVYRQVQIDARDGTPVAIKIRAL